MFVSFQGWAVSKLNSNPGSRISCASANTDTLTSIHQAPGPASSIGLGTWRGSEDAGRKVQKISKPTCPVQVNECLRPKVIVEAFATVLLQLDLLDPHCPVGHLTPFGPHTDAVGQAPIHSNWEPLLGNLVACLHTNMRYIVIGP